MIDEIFEDIKFVELRILDVMCVNLLYILL